MSNPMLRLVPEKGIVAPIDLYWHDEIYYDIDANEIYKVIRDGVVVYLKESSDPTMNDSDT